MRGWVILLVLALTGLAAGCGGSEENFVEPAEDNREGTVGEDALQDAETTGLEGILSSAAFGEGSVWVTDLCNYAYDDAPRTLPSGQGSSASFASPQEVLLKRIDPETREVLVTIALEASHVELAAFGEGSVLALSRDPASPSGEVLRIDPRTNQIVGEILVDDPRDVAFGKNSLWVTRTPETVRRRALTPRPGKSWRDQSERQRSERHRGGRAVRDSVGRQHDFRSSSWGLHTTRGLREGRPLRASRRRACARGHADEPGGGGGPNREHRHRGRREQRGR